MKSTIQFFLITLLLFAASGIHAANNQEMLDRANEATDRGDYEIAIVYYEALAEKGVVEAQHNLAVSYYQGNGVSQDYEKYAYWITRAARQGAPLSQVILCNGHFEGIGVPQDYAEAMRWCKKAANQGELAAMVLIGTMYYSGQGVPQDFKEARKWLRKAAIQGEPLAQMKLGIMHNFGHGIPQDYIQAHMWFNLAAAVGDEKARKFRDLVAEDMTTKQVAEAQRLARNWKPKTTPSYSPQRARVTYVQTILNNSGYDAGAADGIAGPKTRSAIVKFQNDFELPITGEVTQELVDLIKSMVKK